MRKAKRALFAVLLGLSLVAAACNKSSTTTNTDEQSSAASKLTGSIVADGSSTVFPITQAVAEEWRNEAKKVQVSVGTSGTGGGFKKFCAGETDISDASRPIEKSEVDLCAQKGVEYVELQVAIDGLSVVTNPKNTFATCLTAQELKKVWEPNSSVNNWSQIRSGFPNKAMSLFGPGTDSGTFDYFTKVINGKEKASRSDYTASEDDNVVVRGVEGDDGSGNQPLALGYFGFAYYEQNQTKLKVLAVDAGKGCITPTRGSVISGEYAPLSRPLFVYVSKPAAARPEVKAFIDFYLETVNGIIADVGYVAVPEEALKTSKSKWKEFSAS